ncbi:MAG TPA: carboxypeptidase-like regulatory domain-containing protein [Hanamia sp.]|nr:carboxypeptidase-like regulatory domain-containing protein [Hanamia sp.]
MKTNSKRFFKTVFPFSFFILSSFLLSAQTSYYVVKGKVIDKNTRQPLQGASVFAQNTTIGEASDSAGNFSIGLPDGGYSLVVTYTGYETETMRINRTTSQNDSLVVELSPEVKSLEAVTIAISNEVKDGWAKYGSFFTDNFIGQSKFSKQCVIKNPEVLHFYFSKKRDRLKVLAKEPLIVDNFALGYSLKFAIDSFTNYYNTKTNLFIGYPLFVEMQGDSAQQRTWEENRAIAYKGSMLQLMRSIYARTLTEDGFELQFVVKNNGEDFPIHLENLYGALNYKMDDSTKTVEFHPNQSEVAVFYKKAGPEKIYLDMDTTAKKGFQLSSIFFPKGESFFIEPNGYFYDQEDIISNGYLGFKKMGDMLPYDYEPE